MVHIKKSIAPNIGTDKQVRAHQTDTAPSQSSTMERKAGFERYFRGLRAHIKNTKTALA